MRFDANALVEEVNLIRELSEPFLEAESTQELWRAAPRLAAVARGSAGGRWEIETPLRTVPSAGEYRQSGGGELEIRANVRTVWHFGSENGHAVSVADNVSTSVSITRSDAEIARWTMDIAATPSAPGCGLHAQVKDSPQWFPKGLDVPRIPVFIPTLGAVIEFVLGELFQERWAMHVRAHRSAATWRGLQAQLWTRWLEWQRQIVAGASVSPWLDLKASRCDELDGF